MKPNERKGMFAHLTKAGIKEKKNTKVVDWYSTGNTTNIMNFLPRPDRVSDLKKVVKNLKVDGNPVSWAKKNSGIEYGIAKKWQPKIPIEKMNDYGQTQHRRLVYRIYKDDHGKKSYKDVPMSKWKKNPDY